MLTTGIVFSILAAIISGCSIFYNKLVLVKGIDPLIFNILKNGGVALLLTSLLLSTKKVRVLISLSTIQWVRLLAIAIVGGSIPFILYFDALQHVSAINANIIQKSLFIWVAMMAIPLLGERLSLIQVIGFVIVAMSNLFIGGFSGFTFSRPELMIMLATLCWSLELIIAKVALQTIESTIVIWARMFIGVLILVGVALFQGKLGLLASITTEQLLAISGSILFLCAYVTVWYKALSLAPATLVTSVLILATPITNILSALFITHTLPTPHIINVVGTSIGILLMVFVSKFFNKTDTLAVS